MPVVLLTQHYGAIRNAYGPFQSAEVAWEWLAKHTEIGTSDMVIVRNLHDPESVTSEDKS